MATWPVEYVSEMEEDNSETEHWNKRYIVSDMSRGMVSESVIETIRDFPSLPRSA